MSDNKTNTVGWWLNTLKEPLRSRALTIGANSLQEHCTSLKEAIDYINEMGDYPDSENSFWGGVEKAFSGMQAVYGNLFLSEQGWAGWNMAKDCAPDQPSETVTISVVATEKDSFGSPEAGPMLLKPNAAFLTSQEIIDCEKYPILVQRKSAMQEWYDQLQPSERQYPLGEKWKEIPAPKAVEGYEPPRAETIEWQHEQKIKKLEARVTQLEKLYDAMMLLVKKVIEGNQP